MKCTECPDYRQCSKKHNLTIKRKHCPKAKEERIVTNADRIRAMSDEELAELLSQTAYAGATPWCEPFARKFCDNCPTVEVMIVETGKTMQFNECDFADGKCPHGSDIVWWLGQPAEVPNGE